MNTIRKPRGASTDDSVYKIVIELLSTPEIVEKINWEMIIPILVNLISNKLMTFYNYFTILSYVILKHALRKMPTGNTQKAV